MKGDEPLDTVEFGPTFAKTVPYPILEEYVFQRYGKRSFCDFPYSKVPDQSRPILQPHSSQLHVAVSKWYTTPRMRDAWAKKAGKVSGMELTNEVVPYLDDVEIDNSIAPKDACQISSDRPLKVLAFNHERGTYWFEFAEMVRTRKELESPDIIILNEMDIGMARSGNIHTARKLAFELEMNYAWGLEFIELTRGTKKEQIATEGKINSMGLHGNAILSTCKLYDPLVARDNDAVNFSNESSWKNAHGYEKRLGGRMALFARTGRNIPDKDAPQNGLYHHVIVGSVDKVGSHHKERLSKYFGREGWNLFPKTETGTILAGNLIDPMFCEWYGLHNLGIKSVELPTFKVNCFAKNATLRGGKRRIDRFCSNMLVREHGEVVVLPCYMKNGTAKQISDHFILGVTLQS